MLRLQQKQRAHHRGVRSAAKVSEDYVVTGGNNGTVIVWRYNTPCWTKEADFKLHSDTVMALAMGPLYEGNVPTFVSGGRDGDVKWTTITGETLQVFPVQATVSSVCVSPDGKTLYSGDWDARCIAWDIATAKQKAELKNCHRYAVTCTVYVTPEGETQVITASQDGCINVWDGISDKPLYIIENAHTDIIRVLLVTGNTLYSCSNDGSVAEISLENYTLIRRITRNIESFLFAMALLDEKTLIVGGEGRKFVIFQKEDQNWKWVVNIDLNSTVWVIIVSHGEVFIGNEAGYVSIWTTEPERVAPPELQAQYDAEDNEAAANGNESININELTDEAQLHTIKGKREGQHRLFRRGEEIIVYVWEKDHWSLLGQMLGPKETTPHRPYYEGDPYFPAGSYDYVFQVEVGEGASELKKLPFNKTDNPQQAADLFCNREGIGKVYVNEIVKFIHTNADILPPTSAHRTVPANNIAPQKPPLLNNPILFSNGNLNMIHSRLLEHSDKQPIENQLTPLEKQYLNELISGITDCSLIKNKTFRRCELDLIFANEKLSKWPPEAHLPIYDLRRLMALNQGSVDYCNWTTMSLVLKFVTIYGPTDEKQLAGAAECAAKYLANLLSHSGAIQRLELHINEFIDNLPTPMKEGCRAIQVTRALCAVLANYTLLLSRTKTDSQFLKRRFENICCHLDSASNPDCSAVCLILTALCQLVSHPNIDPSDRKEMISKNFNPLGLEDEDCRRLEQYLIDFL